MVVVDSSILIDYLRTKRSLQSTFERLVAQEKRANLAVSILTAQELYQGKSIADPEQETILLSVMNALKNLPYTFDTAKRAGEIVRTLNRPIGFVDAAIAATAIEHGASLATLNPRDFTGIPDLAIISM